MGRSATDENSLSVSGMGVTSTPTASGAAASRTRGMSSLPSASRRKRTETDVSPRNDLTVPPAPEMPLGSWTLKAISHTPRIEKDASRWTVDDEPMDDTVQDISQFDQSSVSGSPLALGSGKPDWEHSGTKPTSESSPQPGPSRVSSRTKKKSQRAVEYEGTAHLLGINIRPSSSTSSPKAMGVPRGSSIASTSSRISVLHRQSLTRSEFPTEEEPRHEREGRNQIPSTSKTTSSAMEMDVEMEDVQDIDIDGTMLQGTDTSEASRCNRRRSSPERSNYESANSTAQRTLNSEENDGTSSTPRRGTRSRKASEAMKEYTTQVGPRFSKRLSGKAMPVSSGIRLPPPPPLESVNDDSEERVRASRIPSLDLKVEPFNTRSGFSLPSVAWHPPIQTARGMAATTSDASLEEPTATATSAPRTALPRTAKKRVTASKSSIAASSPAQTSRAAKVPAPSRAVLPPNPTSDHENVSGPGQPQSISDIPFPPCDPEDGENEYLTAVDFADAKLMAAFAVLDASGNKAMSAEHIAEVCLERGWLSKELVHARIPSSCKLTLESASLGTAAGSCISNVIRSYQRRCQSAMVPRKSIVSKRILFGGFPEARLFPGLHQDMLKKLLDAGKERPRGGFFYLEGWVGSARWKSPFAGLDIGTSHMVDFRTWCSHGKVIVDTPAEPSIQPLMEEEPRSAKASKAMPQVSKPATQSANRNNSSQPSRKRPVAQSRKAPTASSRPTENALVPSASATSSAQPELSPKLRFKIPPKARIGQKNVPPSKSLPARPMPSLAQPAHRDSSAEESDGDTGQFQNSSDTDEDASMSGRFCAYKNLLINFDADSGSDSQSASDSDTDSSDDISEGGSSAEAANSTAVERKTNSNPTIYLSLSGDNKAAVFPDNPLGPVVWDQGLDRTPPTYAFDGASFADLPSQDFQDDVAMQDLTEEVFGVYQSARASSGTSSATPGIHWFEERAAFRDPPDLYHEDADTPPTSPESYSDAADDDYPMIEASDIVQIQHSEDGDEVVDDSLVNAVRTLRGLLSGDSKSPTSSTIDFTFKDVHGSHKQAVRRLRFRSEESTKISLALPPCIPSPSSSPQSPSSLATNGTDFVSETPPSPSPSKDYLKDRLTSTFVMSPGLQEQGSQFEIECHEICEFDAMAKESGILNEVKDVHRQLFEAVNTLSEGTAVQGPESLDLDEFDRLWSSSFGGASASISSRLMHHEGSGMTVGKETLSTTGPHMGNEVLNETPDSTRKRLAIERNAHRLTISTIETDNRLRMDIDEDDRIGIKELDDAMLCCWLEEEVDDATGPSCSEGEDEERAVIDSAPHEDRTSHLHVDHPDLGRSESENPFELECDPHETSIAVDPNLLGIFKPVTLQVPRTLPTVPSLGRCSKSHLSATWKNANHPPQGSKAIPPLAVRPRAMVQCAALSQSELTCPIIDPPATSVSPQADAGQSPTNRRRDRASVRIEDKLTTINVESIPVFALPWGGIFLLRRIDSDYSKFISSGLARLPTN